ncbi:MAG: DUF4091 domain-containing protein [Candidatus Omnitrophota bacterium]|jgi:hypothetical protein|nr:MAG: DUF4091 domain-containing protein [Candidatus Omnitrophota bacterium]
MRVKWSSAIHLFFFVMISQNGWVESSIQLNAISPTIRIGPTEPFDGKEIVEMECAKNEFESMQIVVTAKGGNLQQVDAEFLPLIGPDQGEIGANHITLFREIFVPVRYSSPRATLPPGWYPDPLVPFLNPYTGEPVKGPRWTERNLEGGRFGGGGFDLWENHHQPLWIDIHVPENAKTGVYKGSIRVSARNSRPVEMPIRLTVWDFTLPDGPTHENHFGGFGYVARYHDLKTDSKEYESLEEKYIAMMAAHRLNPPLPSRFHPAIDEDGSIQATDSFDRQLSEFVQKYHMTNIEIPRAPFRDVINADREKAIHYYRSWYAYLQKKGWEKRAYLYMLDEPNDADAYERVRQLGAMVHEADARIRCLVVEQPYLQDPNWGPLDDAIDIWCPLFGFIHQPSIEQVQDQGDEVWSYSALVQSAPRYHPDYDNVKNDNPPYWQIDFPVTAYRIAPWLNRRYNVTGLLYWSTVFWLSPKRNPWDDPGFRIRFNGDGFLFYPGNEAGIDGPIASIRLKNLRDGMEDYEYFTILEQKGGNEIVNAIVREAVPTWGSWNQDSACLPTLRKRLAEEIVKRN